MRYYAILKYRCHYHFAKKVNINMRPAEEMLGCDFSVFIDIIFTPISKNLNVSELQNIYAQSM
jgi:hypothetical protein